MAYNNRGIAYLQLRETTPFGPIYDPDERAIQDFDKAIQLDPNDGDAYVNRGLAYDALGQYAKANADKAKACSLDSQWC